MLALAANKQRVRPQARPLFAYVVQALRGKAFIVEQRRVVLPLSQPEW